MGDRKAKDALFDGFALVGKAVASGRRAEIIDVLGQGERSVEDIAGEISQSVANTSQHLQQLLRAGLVVTRREGNHVFYALSSPRVGDLWAAVRDVAASQVAEVDRLADAYLGDRSQLESISKNELAQRLRSGQVVVLDVRPSPEFAAGHIRGAISIPVAELDRRLKELPKDKQIVAYCRGQYCVYADDAVRALTKKGYDAARLEDGYPEWVRAGLPASTPA